MKREQTINNKIDSDRFFIASLERIKEESLILPDLTHRSELYELVFVTEGHLVRRCDLSSIRMNKNELHVLSAGQITSLDMLSDNVKGYYCRFGNQFFRSQLFGNILDQELVFISSFMYRYPLIISNSIAAQIERSFKRILELYTEREVYFPLVQSYFTAIIYEIKKILLKDFGEPYLSKPVLISKQYLDLLAKHIAESQDIGFYADLLNISPNHLNKSVKKVTGKPASVLLNEARILEAKVQLKRNDITIGDIAFNLGFTDLSYFSKCFRKVTGVSPSDYRNV